MPQCCCPAVHMYKNLLLTPSCSIPLALFPCIDAKYHTTYILCTTVTSPSTTVYIYLAPSLLRWATDQGSGRYAGSMSHAVDVYAFGVVLWEMYTAQRPWAGMRQAQIVHTVCSLGQQLEFPYGTPDRFEVSHAASSSRLPVSVPAIGMACCGVTVLPVMIMQLCRFAWLVVKQPVSAVASAPLLVEWCFRMRCCDNTVGWQVREYANSLCRSWEH